MLVPSSLLGPATWAAVGDVLLAGGHRVVVARVDDVVEASAGLDGPVLVPHSNAGYFAPSSGLAVGAVATVYVDAALPLGPGPEAALAPPEFYAFLEGLVAEDGLLPPWTGWWDDLGDLFPDEQTRASVEAEQQRLPLEYFARTLPVLPGWAEWPAAYLAFGDTYAAEVAFAREHGWPVTVLAGQHLHQLHDPEAVAAAIVVLAAQVAE